MSRPPGELVRPEAVLARQRARELTMEVVRAREGEPVSTLACSTGAGTTAGDAGLSTFFATTFLADAGVSTLAGAGVSPDGGGAGTVTGAAVKAGGGASAFVFRCDWT